MIFSKVDNDIRQLRAKALSGDGNEALNSAIVLANSLIKVLDPSATDLKFGDDALDRALSPSDYPSQTVEGWFAPHPYYKGDKVALNLYQNDIAEFKFYKLGESATKARVSGAVMLSPNWEDSKLTRNDAYKLGVDFFLTANNESLLMVVSNGGNLRVMDFSDKLSHTQNEILSNINGALSQYSKETAHKYLWESLALSEVNKKFYDGIAAQFNILLAHLKNNGRDIEDAKLFSSRLIGRLLFVWFLRKKHIINEKENYFDLKEFGANSTAYYDQKLKQLFFNTLNREKLDPLRGTDKTTPYLNGGLFDPHPNDWVNETIDFPQGFFNGLYEHLNKYNFTTDESSPEYEQVAIDPEMLGRVFETLLASQNEDTGKSVRKAKGAFYTPRDIVSYMCRESLRHYLYDKINNATYNRGIDMLLDASDHEWEIDRRNKKRDLWGEGNMEVVIDKVKTALDNLKILDPACGSGAFPMGMLQLLLRSYERLEPRFDPYKTKLSIIENNIFGVDIEPMAVEISRLRAWLSVIVDEKDVSNIQPLPNLEFKFVCANSLIPLEENYSLFAAQNMELQDKLLDLRSKYFNARKPERKHSYQREYYRLTNLGTGQTSMIEHMDNKLSQIKSFDPFKNKSCAKFFDANYMFGVQGGFDLVIGNPPYVHLEKIQDKLIKEEYSKLYATYTPRGDLYSMFYELGLKSLKQGGFLTFITSNKWMRAGYGERLRDYFLKFNPIRLIDLGGGRFSSATVDTNILIIQNTPNRHELTAVSYALDNLGNISAYIKQNSVAVDYKPSESWAILSPIEQSIKKKIEAVGTPLREWDIKINRGILTGCNEAFIIDQAKRDELVAEDPKSAEIIRPILRGRDIKRNGYNWEGLYVILAYFGAHRIIPTEYPAIYKHLLKYKDKLSNRGQCRYTSSGKPNTRADYPGQHHWLELDNNPRQDYLDDFSKQKVVFPAIMSRGAFFSVDDNGYALVAPANMVTGNNIQALASFLVSDVCYFALRRFYMGGGIEGELKVNRLLRLPIPINVVNRVYNADEISGLYGLNEEEMNFISDSFKQ